MKYIVVAVDDGSDDGTANVVTRLAKEYPLRLVSHDRNRGLSAALRSGLSAVLYEASDQDVVTTMDGDDTHDPMYLNDMLREIEKGADVVIASRYVKGGVQLSVPFSRICLSRAINLLIGLVSGLGIRDATSGFRCFRASALKKARRRFGEIPKESKGFEAPLEILYRTKLCVKSIVEIPFRLEYNNKKGKSKMNIPTTILQYLDLLFKIALWRLNIDF
jgi:dolichol-phosphate mannosyltransferase